MSAVNFSISISYPPLFKQHKRPYLSQNRQFQWTNTGDIIYPVIPASAATLLKQHGFTVFWDDAIAQNLSYSQWLKRLLLQRPNLVAIETKTPVIQKHWKIIKQLKKLLPKSTIVLMGDHVTALPQESFRHCPVGHILCGGDYDFMLLDLANQLSQNQKPKKIIKVSPNHSLDDLPIIDRQLTQWHLYAYHNTNYKYKPGAYIMSGRDCWWGKCTFCSWTTLFPHNRYRCFSPEHSFAEIKNLVENYGVREVFDDSGTLPIGPWLKNFCHLLIKNGLNRRIKIGCNMRFSALSLPEYQLMKQAGFRFILYGLESSNQPTLNKINKNLQTSDAAATLKFARQAGLNTHLTVMIGYPWENFTDAQKTINQAKQFFKQGLATSIQATLIIPYPGTPLFKYCRSKKLLTTANWSKYDMSQPVIKSLISPQKQIQLIHSAFKGVLTPVFLFRQIVSIRSLDDIKHLFSYAVKFIRKLKDFS